MYVRRTGRAGRSGVGITFVMADQARDVGSIAHDLRLHSQFAQSGLRSPRDERGHGRRERSRNGKRRSRAGRTS